MNSRSTAEVNLSSRGIFIPVRATSSSFSYCRSSSSAILRREGGFIEVGNTSQSVHQPVRAALILSSGGIIISSGWLRDNRIVGVRRRTPLFDNIRRRHGPSGVPGHDSLTIFGEIEPKGNGIVSATSFHGRCQTQ